MIRRPWPVAAVPDVAVPDVAVPDGAAGVTAGGAVAVEGAVLGPVVFPDGVPAVAPTTVLPGAAAAVTDVTRVPVRALPQGGVAGGTPPLIVMRPVRAPASVAAPGAPGTGAPATGAPPAAVPTAPAPGASGPLPPRRAPIRREHVPGTPVRVSRPVWGPPQPAV